MLKKIILGIVITAVLSVTAFGAVYAYQNEKAGKYEPVNMENLQIQYGAGPRAECDNYATRDHESCLKEEERARNNLRIRENENQECNNQDCEEQIWQHRYEYQKQLSGIRQGDCDESSQSRTQNGKNSNGRGGRQD